MSGNEGRNGTRATARALAALAMACGLAACAPEVGTDAWCKDMDATPKGDWSSNDAASYAKHCVLGLKPDKQ